MRASAAIPSLFTPVMQGNRMLVDGGILNPLPIVPVVSSHCDLIIAVNLNATNQKQYQLPVIERPAAFKMRFDSLLSSLGSRLPFRRKPAEELMRIEQEIAADGLAPPNPWLADAATRKASNRRRHRNARARQNRRPARSSSTTWGLLRCWT